jgi:Flp pilus assembly pilin Flp
MGRPAYGTGVDDGGEFLKGVMAVGGKVSATRVTGHRRGVAQRLAIRQFISGLFKGLDKDELGTPLLEYALLLALIALVAVATLLFLDGSSSSGMSNLANHLNNVR